MQVLPHRPQMVLLGVPGPEDAFPQQGERHMQLFLSVIKLSFSRTCDASTLSSFAHLHTQMHVHTRMRQSHFTTQVQIRPHQQQRQKQLKKQLKTALQKRVHKLSLLCCSHLMEQQAASLQTTTVRKMKAVLQTAAVVSAIQPLPQAMQRANNKRR